MNNSGHVSKYLKKMRLEDGFLPLRDATLILVRFLNSSHLFGFFFLNNTNALIYKDDESRHDVHKVVLASKSKFFDDLFLANDVWTYTISCVSDKAMKAILDAFYGIECSEVLEPEIRQEIIDLSKELGCKCPLVNCWVVPSSGKILSYEEVEELQLNKNE